MPAVHERLVDLLERLFLQHGDAEEAKDDLDGYLRRHGFQDDDISGEAIDGAMQDVALRLHGPGAGVFSAYATDDDGGHVRSVSVARGHDAPPRPPARLRGESDWDSGRRQLQHITNNIRQGDTYNIDNSIDQRGSVNATAATGGSTAQGGRGNTNLIDDDGPDIFRGPGRPGGRGPGFRGDDDGDDGNVNQAGSVGATAATGGSTAQGGTGNINIIDDDGPDIFRGPGRPGGRGPGRRGGGDDGDDGNVNQAGSTNATAATGGSTAQGGRGNTNIIDDDGPDIFRGPGRPGGRGPGRRGGGDDGDDGNVNQAGSTNATAATGGSTAQGGRGNTNIIDDDGPDIFRGPGRPGGRGPGLRGDDGGDDGNVNQAGSVNATAATGGSTAQGGRGNTNLIDDDGPDIFRGPGRPGGRGPGLRGDDGGDDGNVNQAGSTNATAATGGSTAQGGRGNTNIIDDDGPDIVRAPGGRPAGGVGQAPGVRPATPQQPQQPGDPTTIQTGGTTINAPTTATSGGIAAGGVGNQIGIQSQANSPGAQAHLGQTQAPVQPQPVTQHVPVETAPPVQVDPHSGEVAGLHQEATQVMDDSPGATQGITQHQDPTAFGGQEAGQVMDDSGYASQTIGQTQEDDGSSFGSGYEAHTGGQQVDAGYVDQEAGQDTGDGSGGHGSGDDGSGGDGIRIEDDFGLGDGQSHEPAEDMGDGSGGDGTRIEDDFGLGDGQSHEPVDETTGMHAGTMPAEEHPQAPIVDDEAHVDNTGSAEATTSPYEHTASPAPIQDPVQYEPPAEEAQYEEPEPVPNYEQEPVYMHEEPQADPGGEGYGHGGGESM